MVNLKLTQDNMKENIGVLFELNYSDMLNTRKIKLQVLLG